MAAAEPDRPLRRASQLRHGLEIARIRSSATAGFTNVHNEYLKSPANVVCHAAKSIRFDRCTFTQLGGAGLDIEFGSQDNVVSGCRFFDISGTAVQIGDVLKDDHHPDDPRKIVKNNTVENCYIHDCCIDYIDGVGIFAGYTEGTRIAHNEICRLPYSGISMGWGWGRKTPAAVDISSRINYDTPTPAKNNRIEMQPHPSRDASDARWRRHLYAGKHARQRHPRQSHP